MITLGRDKFMVGLLTRSEWEPDLEGYANWARMDLNRGDAIKCMPPTPFVQDLEVTGSVGGYPPVAAVQAKFRPTPLWDRVYRHWVAIHGKDVARQMADYRQRFAVGASCLGMNEFDKKRRDYAEHVDQLRQIIDPWLDQFYELTHKIGPILRDYVGTLSIGPHTYEFINRHKDSSVAPGISWSMLTDSDLQVLLESAIQLHEFVAENWDQCVLDHPECYALYPKSMHFGRRHRGVKQFVWQKGNVDVELTRDRIVAYNGAIGSFNAFCPNPLDMYRDVLALVEKELWSGVQILSPILQGGDVYRQLADAVGDGYHYVNADVSTYDLYAPLITGVAGCSSIPIGELVLGSGVHNTSQTGSQGNLCLCKAWAEEYDLHPIALGILGDDSAWVLPEGEEFRSMEGVFEEDKLGSSFEHYLGFSLMHPGGHWHPVGFKVTVDKARADLDIRSIPVPWNHKLSPQEVAAFEAVYKGYVVKDGVEVPMREILSKVDLEHEDFVSPAVVRRSVHDYILASVPSDDNEEGFYDIKRSEDDA